MSNVPENHRSHNTDAASLPISRRGLLYGLGASIGSVALTGLLGRDGYGSTPSQAESPLAPKPGHLQGKAKACIFLMMEGGPSHIDTFDPKPKLRELHLKEFTRGGENKSAMESGKRYYVQSPFRFRKVGDSGADMAENWMHLAEVADEICFYRGCQAESVNHPTAMYHMNTGNRFGGDPAVGAWVTYALGSENQNLPGFLVLPELAYPQGGPANWGNGFLPAHYQGTPLRAQGTPILDLQPPAGISPDHQRQNLDLLARMNRRHLEQYPAQDELAARMASYELAARMQMQVPGILDIQSEDASVGACSTLYKAFVLRADRLVVGQLLGPRGERGARHQLAEVGYRVKTSCPIRPESCLR